MCRCCSGPVARRCRRSSRRSKPGGTGGSSLRVRRPKRSLQREMHPLPESSRGRYAVTASSRVGSEVSRNSLKFSLLGFDQFRCIEAEGCLSELSLQARCLQKMVAMQELGKMRMEQFLEALDCVAEKRRCEVSEVHKAITIAFQEASTSGGWASVSVSAPECSWCLPGFWTSQIQTGSIYTYLARVRLQTVPPRVAFKLSGPRAFRLQSLCTKQPAYACLLPSLLPAEDEGPPNPTCSHSGSGTRNPEMFLDAQPMFRCNMLLSTACAMTALRCLNAEFVFVREVQSGLCVEVSGSGDTDSPLRLLDCGFGVQNSKQVWYFRDGEFVSVWSQLCADVYSWGIGRLLDCGFGVQNSKQVWYFRDGEFVSVWSQLCADVYSWGIGLWPCRRMARSAHAAPAVPAVAAISS
eukprot:s10465_g2.t1